MKFMDEQCAVCGGHLIEKTVEKLLKGGNNMACATVAAEVCLHCGERFYAPEIIERFEEIESELEREEIQNFQMVGHAFQVAF